MAKTGVTVVLGGQWGDEGKGKLTDIFGQGADIVARCQGGSNADHTVNVGQVQYNFHLLPSGILNSECTSVIGNGVVIHLAGLFAELQKFEDNGFLNWQERLVISNRAHIVLDVHQEIDRLLEKEKAKTNSSVGTTKRGIGPTYTAKCARTGLRICDLYADANLLRKKLTALMNGYQKRFPGLKVDIEEELKKLLDYADRLRPMVKDTVLFLNSAIQQNKKIVVEGANALMLDVDFGAYPFVTSSNCTCGVACTGLGIPVRSIKNVYGAFRAYTIKVGNGAFPTELKNELGDKIRRLGHEYGGTTGRPLRCGWFDLVVARYSNMINGYTCICVNKLDILDTLDEIKIGIAYRLDGKVLKSIPAEQSELERVEVEYMSMPGWKTSIADIKSAEELPENAMRFIEKLQELIGVKIQWIGNGPDRTDIIELF